ncbi:DUF4166 domain-containing protein [Jannaschia sp. M317]|uniref:DUF4166 domain-containing protein n=1 Tax=Jannaschia sp. M317 TaxID=2867011 RepID=UPI0021A50EDD|nr:DUF4166 domain-containing protein [Jannaschia sp. M317]UWQ17503.1 DUF4166 domain-containing protein [Jannaschia sp. M317]
MTSLFARALGPAFAALPEPLRRLHAPVGQRVWRGTAHLTQGGWFARRLARGAGFPVTEGPVPLDLTITTTAEGEVWTRHFGGHRLSSTLSALPDGQIAERIGPFVLILRPRIDGEALLIPVVGMRLGPLPLPSGLAPRGGGRETTVAECVAFDVDSRLPGLGRILRYRGTLTEDTP